MEQGLFEAKLKSFHWKETSPGIWHKDNCCFELDNEGFFYWKDGARAAGLVWDSIPDDESSAIATFGPGEIVIEL